MLDTKYLGAIMKTFKNTKFENIIVVGRGRVALGIYEIVKNDFENAILYSGKEGDDHFNSLKNCFIISANNLYVFKPLCVENNTIIKNDKFTLVFIFPINFSTSIKSFSYMWLCTL